jgi:hypothetical protein
MLAKVKRAEAGCHRLAFQLTRNRGRLVLPRGYTRGLHRLSGRARNPYFTGLSRSYFKVAEREGFEPLFTPNNPRAGASQKDFFPSYATEGRICG